LGEWRERVRRKNWKNRCMTIVKRGSTRNHSRTEQRTEMEVGKMQRKMDEALVGGRDQKGTIIPFLRVKRGEPTKRRVRR